MIYVGKHTPSFVPQKDIGKTTFFEIVSYKSIRSTDRE